ncbi:phosphate ABC transporter substrate-binding protein [Lactobacillus sp. ESL0731]|uniref:phosphate ABC transporter substrate-binding protein n=1 Tax=unclassified Lactobacillus TaxID=2620435 RepID=UPI0023F9A8EF|nr:MULTISPECIES: phosphate ABC transporter substrate-binding protein [unclassified Lactobacillus]WEV50680.1 phosphate ABC transporter substrate-binding protein [Lactobacillus sp. ESL0700]WEV61810.1 phosphate ABC transporter substrate-binding protein [Lactobacillus sp. ESL0731]
MHKLHLGKLMALILLLPIFLVGCSKDRNKITIVGSSALQPLVEQAGNDYHLTNPDSNIIVQGGGSGTGLSQVQAGAVQIGTADVFADTQKGIDAAKLHDFQVAVVGIVPIVNKGIGINNLSSKQLMEIFTGKITNWRQVGGKNLQIIVINRSRGSGTRTTFEDLILKGKDAINSQEQDSNGTVKKIVSSTPGTISYISFPYANDPNIQKLSIDHIRPTNQNIPTNKWRLWSYEHLYTKGKPDKETAAFINYILSKKVQRDLVPKIGYLSINEMKVTRDSQNRITKIGSAHE